ncbi:MAG TPA: GNAT family N-acetyltransferase [Labilithrix sp.]
MGVLRTPRLWLEPITLPMVEAVFAGDRERLEDIAGAKIPEAWPGRALVERAFSASLDRIRESPDVRLWGDRLVIAGEAKRVVVGSVIFHGRPSDGVAEVGYGVEESWQRKGIATEATSACVEWALGQEGIVAVTATTPPWHLASVRVLEKSGLARTGSEEHAILGEVLRFERRR